VRLSVGAVGSPSGGSDAGVAGVVGAMTRVPRLWVTHDGEPFHSAYPGMGLPLTLAMSLLWLILPATAASAVTCPPSPTFEFLSEHWEPSDHVVSGMRASIVLRKGSHSGSVCTPDGHTDAWVAVEDSSISSISQIGWTHDGTFGYCRFTEWFTPSTFNPPVLDRCGTDADGTSRFFKVRTWFNPEAGRDYYGIYDCGTADWVTCTLLDDGAPDSGFPSPIGAVVAESSDGSGCINDFLGSPNYRVRFGESTNEIRGQRTTGGSWGVKTLNYYDLATCSHYKSDEHTDTTFRTFDDRNS
jgi:hypothetical protein